MGDFKLGTCTVPDGVSGNWRIETFTVSQKESDFTRLRATIGRNYHEYVPAGTYRRLMRGGTVVMSNTPMEISTNREAYRSAKGRVLINGLGLGMILEAILSKPDVEHVRIVEKSPDVIALVAPHFAHDPRVEIIDADAMQWRPAKGEKFGYAWHDIWDDICSDNLSEMATLARAYARRVDLQGFWAKAECRRLA